MTAAAPRRVVVLGGGIAGLTAALELSATAELRKEYSVTVLTSGFRLGGKGASGVNREKADRIEEHGLHVWMGFYENAFRLIRGCYAELGRPLSSPLATFEDAFKPHDYIVWEEVIAERHRHWFGPFKQNDSRPGEGAPMETPTQYLFQMLPRIVLAWDHMRQNKGMVDRVLGTLLEPLVAALNLALRGVSAEDLEGPAAPLLRPLAALRDKARELAARKLWASDEARRIWIGFDLFHTVAMGMIADGMLKQGFDVANDEDFRDWLRRHGASEATIASGLVRPLYDFVFAYEGGDPQKPRAAAGVTLRIMLRMQLSYRGAMFYRMQAGMGETVFAPIYEVLLQRGVRFEFFRSVKHLGLSQGKRAIETLRVGRQATVKEGDYRPLIDVRGLPCFPTEPLFDQLVEGEVLSRDGVDIESHFTAWRGAGEFELQRGRDFDEVVLAIPLPALAGVADELACARPEWGFMFDHLKCVTTQAMQLWLKGDAASLGWTRPSPILTGYAYPLSTWADFTHLLPREGWGAEGPRSLAYFCGPMQETWPEPPASDADYPERATAEAKAQATAWLEKYAGHLWPLSTKPGHADAFDPRQLFGEGYEGQLFKANVSPSDRYVLSVPGSVRYRLRPDGSGFENLFLAGDWVKTGLDIGCIEAAVMAGMLAARAICGSPQKIAGETDFSG